MNILIRPMRVDDIDQVHAIDVQSFTLPWTKRSYRYDLTENETARMWVAEKSDDDVPNQIVGMLVLWFVIDEAHIGTIAVHPDYRRQGIGKKIILHALRHAVAENIDRVFLEVRKSNIYARELYKQIGFEVVSVRKGYYQDNGEDALLMNLEGLKSIQKFESEK